MKEKLNKTVLIADDDNDLLFQLKLNLENMGFDVMEAHGQKEAEGIMSENKPDLAIFDLIMENQDSGFVLAYKMKNKYPETPVIIATAVTAETGMVFGIETEADKNWIKADRYIEKNIRPDQLRREVFKLLKL